MAKLIDKENPRIGDSQSLEQKLARAVDFHNQQDFSQAESMYREILVDDPNNYDALHYYGLLAFQLGNHDVGLGLVDRAIQAAPDFADAHNTKGFMVSELGRHDEALPYFDAALSLEPDHGGAVINKGNTLMEAGRYEDAISALDEGIAKSVDDPMLFNNKGIALGELDRFEEAVTNFDRALSIDPTMALIHINRGAALKGLGKLDDAQICFDQAIIRDPYIAEAHNNRGSILLAKGGFKESILCFDTALKIRPDYAEALNAKGAALIELGRNGEALACISQALEVRPNYVTALYSYSQAHASTPENENVRDIEKLLETTGLKPGERIQLNFALGKTLNDLGRYNDAFAHFQQGNQIDRREPAFDADAHDAVVERIIECFNKDLFSNNVITGNPSDRPIFIVGMPRSGTTLTEQILASHSKVFGAGELPTLIDLADTISGLSGGSLEYPESVRDLDIDIAAELAKRYLRDIGKRRGPVPHVTDKTPGNFLYLGLIALILPNAKIIHCRRHPLDTALSCFTQYFSPTKPFTNSLDGIGRYHAAYEKLMAHWADVLATISSEMLASLAARWFTVQT